MTYDAADRLTGIDAAGSANDATFSVDALGRFRTRVVNGTTDTYSYVGTSEVVARIATGAGTLDSITTTGGDRLGIRSGGTLNYLVPDPHGNVAGSLSADEATIVNAIRYDAYGETIATGSAGGSAVGAGAWTYQGRLDVSPSGLASPLLDMSARFYAPAIGAFTSLDSVMGSAQNPLSMNRYLYAHANPATLIDPTGHYAMEFEYGYTQRSPDPRHQQVSRRCQSRGDYGCGQTASHARVKPAPAARKPRVMPGHPGRVNRNSGSEARFRALARDQAAGWSMRLERQRAYDNDFWGGVSDGLWDSTAGFAGQIWDNGVLVATNLDKLPEVGARTAGGVGGLASGTVNTGVEIATHLDKVPERTASLAAEIDQGSRATIAAIQAMNPRQWGYVGGTGLGVTGTAAIGGGVAGALRTALRGASVRGFANATADLARSIRPRPGAAGAAVSADGSVFPAVSGGNQALHPTVRRILDSIPDESKPFGGACVEPRCISNMLTEGVSPRGATISTVKVRAPGNPSHAQPLAPCPACQILLEEMDMTWVR